MSKKPVAHKPKPELRKLDLRPYAGRWVALVAGRVAGVGLTAEEARIAAKLAHPKEEPVIRFVPERSRRMRRRRIEEVALRSWAETLVHDPLVQTAVMGCAEHDIAACVVGGAVRNLLLGRPVHDWDFVVERDAIRLARIAADRLGAAFFPLDEERDTGRVVAYDADGRRTFLDFAVRRGMDWRADLEARDFTINAMALPLETSEVSQTSKVLIDPFGGQADLAARLVRAVTEHSLRDDPVRTMRAVRLAGELCFQIEPQTAEWIRQSASLLINTSTERVRDELGKLLAQPDAFTGIRRMDDFGLLAQVLPEVAALRGVEQSHPHHWPVLEHTLFVLAVLERVIAIIVGQDAILTDEGPPAFVWNDVKRVLADFRQPLATHLAQPLGDERPALVAIKLAALLHDCAKPQTRTVGEDGRTHFYGHEDMGAPLAAERVRALRFTNVEVERARLVVENHMRPQQLADAESGVTRRAAYRFFRDTGDAGVDVLLLALADHIATHGPDVEPERWGRRIRATGTLLAEYWAGLAEGVAPLPLVSGHELMKELGLRPGKRIGELLEAIREAQAAGEVATRQEALAIAKSLLNK